MPSFTVCFHWSVALTSLLWTILTTFNLTQFLSTQPDLRNGSVWGVAGAVRFSCERGPFLLPLLSNVLYAALFCAQHSLMGTSWWKSTLHAGGLGRLQRCVYTLATCLTLQLLMGGAVPLPLPPLWCFNTGDSLPLWLAFTQLHAAMWVVILCSALALHPLSLVGLTQATSEQPMRDEQGEGLVHAGVGWWCCGSTPSCQAR